MINLKKLDRIELLYMGEDPAPIPIGTLGTVTRIDQVKTARVEANFYQISVDWDNDRKLMLSIPPDRVRIVYR